MPLCSDTIDHKSNKKWLFSIMKYDDCAPKIPSFYTDEAETSEHQHNSFGTKHSSITGKNGFSALDDQARAHTTSSQKPHRKKQETTNDRGKTSSQHMAGAKNNQTWPLSLIAIAGIATLLLTIGGYGILQQRSAMQEEIQQLQQSAAINAAHSNERTMAQNNGIAQHNAKLEAAISSLRRENKQLTLTIEKLQTELNSQKKSASSSPSSTAQKTPVKNSTVNIAPPANHNWFVNFGSFTQRTAAESWITRLKPEDGKVIVSTGQKNGSTIYRVRVVELSNKQEAQKIAGQLEQQYGLPKLWVGQR